MPTHASFLYSRNIANFRRQIDPLIVVIAVYGVLPRSTDAQSSAAEKPALIEVSGDE